MVVLVNKLACDRYLIAPGERVFDKAVNSRRDVVAELRRVLRMTSMSFLRLSRGGEQTSLFKLRRMNGPAGVPRNLILMLENQNTQLVSKFLKARDIVKARETELRVGLRREEKLRREARHLRALGRIEPSTGLLNAPAFEKSVQGDLMNYGGALFFLDLNDFKGINDRLGHAAGDKVIRGAAKRLQKIFAAPAICGRVGGDEFTVWLPQAGDAGAYGAKRKIRQAFERGFDVAEGQCPEVGVSIGVALAPVDGLDFEALMANADTRMYKDKARRSGVSHSEDAARACADASTQGADTKNAHSGEQAFS